MNNNEVLRVEVDDGKYTVIQEASGRLKALRYGEEWQDLSGDKLVYCLAAELQEARDKLAQYEATKQAEVPKEQLKP